MPNFELHPSRQSDQRIVSSRIYRAGPDLPTFGNLLSRSTWIAADTTSCYLNFCDCAILRRHRKFHRPKPTRASCYRSIPERCSDHPLYSIHFNTFQNGSVDQSQARHITPQYKLYSLPPSLPLLCSHILISPCHSIGRASLASIRRRSLLRLRHPQQLVHRMLRLLPAPVPLPTSQPMAPLLTPQPAHQQRALMRCVHHSTPTLTL